MSPQVTVLMTVYNGLPYLGEAIDGILAQTSKGFEFLIIDDASTDGSRDLILSYRDPRIRLIENDSNLGQARSLNRGLRLARGEYIARMDQDDVALPRRLEKQMLYMAQHPQVVLLGTWCQFINEMENQIGRFHPPTTYQAILDYFATLNPFAHSSVLFRRVPIQEIGGYQADFLDAADFALWFQLTCQYQVANLPEELVRIRIHPGQTSLSADMKTARRWSALRVYRQVLAHPGLSPQARKAGRRTVARAMLDYAVALTGDGRQRAALRWVGTACLRYPLLCAQDLSIMMIYALLGPRGRELGRSVKRRLHYVRSHERSLDN